MNVALASSSALGAAALFAVASAVQSKAVRDVERDRASETGFESREAATPHALRVVTAIALAVMTLATVLLSRLPRVETSAVARPARQPP